MRTEMSELIGKIVEVGKNWGLYDIKDGATFLGASTKFFEEFGEMSKAISKQNTPLMQDGIGDSIVTLIHLNNLYAGTDAETETNEQLTEQNINMIIDYFSVVPLRNITEQYKYQSIEYLLWQLPVHANPFVSNRVSCYIKAIEILLVLENRFGFPYLSCLQMAYNEIKDRKGKMINGSFVKNS